MRTGPGFPLHRSPVFWVGLWVMGFIAWSWWDSTGCISAATWRDHGMDVRDSGVTIFFDRNQGGGFWAKRMDVSSIGKPWVMRLGRPGFVREEEYPEKLATDEPMDQALRAQMKSVRLGSLLSGGPQDGWACFIPHWLVLVVVVTIWAGLLGWRVRRWRMALVREVEMREAGKR